MTKSITDTLNEVSRASLHVLILLTSSSFARSCSFICSRLESTSSRLMSPTTLRRVVAAMFCAAPAKYCTRTTLATASMTLVKMMKSIEMVALSSVIAVCRGISRYCSRRSTRTGRSTIGMSTTSPGPRVPTMRPKRNSTISSHGGDQSVGAGSEAPVPPSVERDQPGERGRRAEEQGDPRILRAATRPAPPRYPRCAATAAMERGAAPPAPTGPVACPAASTVCWLVTRALLTGSGPDHGHHKHRQRKAARSHPVGSLGHQCPWRRLFRWSAVRMTKRPAAVEQFRRRCSFPGAIAATRAPRQDGQRMKDASSRQEQ
jgi:hypothetical protein